MSESPEQPSKFDHAHYAKEFRGLKHSLNWCMADHANYEKGIKALEEATAKLVEGLRDARAEIGKQAAEIAELEESMKTAREVFGDLQEWKKKSER